MITKNQIREHCEKYTFKVQSTTVNKGITSIEYFLRKDHLLKGRILISRRFNEVDWMLSGVSCNTRGVGKLLYYLAMDKVYPNYITGDDAGDSATSMRVWNALEKVDFVDKKYYPYERDDEESINFATRFKFCITCGNG